MSSELLQAIVNEQRPINITLSLSDLKEIIRTLVHDERKRIDDEARIRHEKPTLTKADAARALGVSISTLDRLSKEGQIIAIKIGNSVRFKQSDIDNYLENNKKIIR